MSINLGFQRNEYVLQRERAKDQKQQQATQNGDENRVPTYKISPGKTTLRVLPPYSERGVWFKETLVHFFSGSPWTCPRPLAQRCPICEEG